MALADTTQALYPVERDHLSVGGVVKSTFRIFGKAPLVFLLFGLVAIAPALTRLILFPPEVPRFDATAAIVLVVNLLLLSVIQTAMTLIAVRLHDDQRVPIGEAVALGLRRFLPMLGTSLLVILAIYAGLLVIIVPGVFLAVLFAVAVPACAVETGGPITSIKRSILLTKGERWHVLGIYCIFFLPMIILSGGVAATLTLQGHLLASQWVSLAIQLVWGPLAIIFSASIYVALRRLKDGVGVARVFD